MCYSAPPMRPLVLFDFDGVIADSLETFETIIKESFSRMGHHFLKTRQDFLELFDDNLYASFKRRGISDKDVRDNFDYVGSKVNFEGIPIYDGIQKMLEQISLASTVAIVSSNKEEQITRTLKGNRIDHYFNKVMGFESGLSKVDKLRLAMKLYGAGPKSTYYVVDTIGDLIEAKEAGVISVAVGWGWHSREKLLSESPDLFVPTCGDLTALVRDACQN